jgi:D-alanyl-D-alanine carboxypeptidase (penicillin-binding protein 5/6)
MQFNARRSGVAFAVLAGLLTAATPAFSPTPAAVAAPRGEPKYAAMVIDATSGEVLYARHADSPRYPASITKVMTLYLVYEALASGQLELDDYVTVSPRAAAQPPSKLGLAAGQRLTVEDAIYALSLRSANDIAVALAEKVAGTEARFAALMTLRAQELGMDRTRFVNASGLPDSRQISSARDIAILSRAILRDHPQYYHYFSTRNWEFRGRAIRNHNGLLGRMPGVDGIKTGFINASGFNLAASGVRDGRRLITVVLGGRTSRSRDDHVAELMETGFEVLGRRARGERIQVAQAEFERKFLQPELNERPIQYAGLNLGVGAEGDLTGALNASSARPPYQVLGVSAEEATVGEVKKAAPAKARTPAKPKRDPNAVWQVQVGAFKAKRDADRTLKDLGRRFRTYFAKAEAKVESGGGWHRAQYQYLTRETASEACKALKKSKVPCLVMRL